MNNSPLSIERNLVVAMIFGLFVSGLDAGVVNIMLPKLTTVFDTTISKSMMLATVYLTIMAALYLFFG